MNLFLKTTLLSALTIAVACAEPESVDTKMDANAPGVDEVAVQTPSGVKITAGDLAGLHIDAGADAPVVLIIPGSGPTDLDGNNPMGVSASTYKLLAQGLAAKGISSVRVDKRGMFSSEAAGNPNAVTLDIYAQDYSNWINTIMEKTDAACVYLLGHSEGALMASAAANINENVCGQILVSGGGRSFGEVLREQLKANPANVIIIKEAFAAIEKLEAGEPVDTDGMHMGLKPLFNKQVQGFLMSVMAVDPAEIAATADVKTLVVHGDTDIQTSVEDAEILAAATGGTLVIVPGVNHVLKEAPLNRRKNIKTYSQPDLPISTDVVDAIAAFVRS